MNPQEVTLKHSNVFYGLEKSNSSKHRFGFSKTSTSPLPSIQCESLCAKCFNAFRYSEQTNDILEDKFCIRDYYSLLRYQKMRDEAFVLDDLFSTHNETSSLSLDLGEVRPSMEKENSKPENMVAASCATEKSYDCDLYISKFKLCMNCHSKISKENQVNIVFEVEKDFEEILLKVLKSDAVTCVHDCHKSTNLQLQNKSFNEKFLTQTLVQLERSVKYENLVTQKPNTEENLLPKISDKAEKLPSSGDYFEVTIPDGYRIEAENYLQKPEKLKVSEDFVQHIDYDKKENDKLKYISSNIEPNNPVDQSSECYSEADNNPVHQSSECYSEADNNPVHQSSECYSEEDNNPVHQSSECYSDKYNYSLEFLLSVFDFLSNSEAANYLTKEQNASTVSQNVEPEPEVSSLHCVQSVQFLLSCIDDVDKYLMEKENEAIELKHYFETKEKELESSCISSTTKYNECKKLDDLKSSSDKLLEDLKKDRMECNWYSKNIQNMSIFLQKNCLNPKL